MQLDTSFIVLPQSSHVEGLAPACRGQLSSSVRPARGAQPAQMCSRVSAQAGPMQARTVFKSVCLRREGVLEAPLSLSQLPACMMASSTPALTNA